MLTIALPDELADRIRAVGQDVHHFAVAAVREKLNELETDAPSSPPFAPDAQVSARLAALQQADKTRLLPDTPTHELFAQWAVEDARMTDAEREAEDRLWEDILRGMNETRAAQGMRLL